MIGNLSNDSMTILTQVLEEMKQEKGNEFDLRKVNLAELERRTGISRKKLRNLKKNGFKEKPHSACIIVRVGYIGPLSVGYKRPF